MTGVQLLAGRLCGETRRLREMAPPPFAFSHGKPAACLLFCVESACLSQLWCSAVLACLFYKCPRHPHLPLILSLSSSLSVFLFFSFLSFTIFLFSSSLRSSFVLISGPPLQHHPCSVLSHFQPTLPAYHPVAHIITLLTTWTHDRSCYGPAKKAFGVWHQSRRWPKSPVLKRKRRWKNTCNKTNKPSYSVTPNIFPSYSEAVQKMDYCIWIQTFPMVECMFLK